MLISSIDILGRGDYARHMVDQMQLIWIISYIGTGIDIIS